MFDVCLFVSLFFGCDHFDLVPMNITSIRIIETGTNYQEIIEAFTLFDNIITSGEYVNLSVINENMPESYWKRLIVIMDHFLNVESEKIFDSFIYDTWRLFLKKKIEIKINMAELDDHQQNHIDASFLNVIFNGAGFKKYEYNEQVNEEIDYFIIPSDDTNIIKFDIFPNLQEINITFAQDNDEYWPFSLSQLLLILRQTKVEKVKIKTNILLGVDLKSWIKWLWHNNSSLIAQYQNEGYSIKFVDDYSDDCLLIQKMS